MQDKTSIGISETFREYIEALVEEVVLNGEPFEAQKKWLRKNSEAEGISYETIESNLTDLFEAIKELEEHESKSGERLIGLLAKECYLSEASVNKLLANAAATRVQKEAKRKAQEEKERKAQEEAERKAKEKRERKAREKAEREAKEAAERKAREERERIAKEEDERIVKEAAEHKARQERERKAKEETERKAQEEAKHKAEKKAREEREKEIRRKENKSFRIFFTIVAVAISVLEVFICGWWCIPALLTNYFWVGWSYDLISSGNTSKFKAFHIIGLLFIIICIWSPSFRWWSLLFTGLSVLIPLVLQEVLDL